MPNAASEPAQWEWGRPANLPRPLPSAGPALNWPFPSWSKAASWPTPLQPLPAGQPHPRWAPPPWLGMGLAGQPPVTLPWPAPPQITPPSRGRLANCPRPLPQPGPDQSPQSGWASRTPPLHKFVHRISGNIINLV